VRASNADIRPLIFASGDIDAEAAQAMKEAPLTDRDGRAYSFGRLLFARRRSRVALERTLYELAGAGGVGYVGTIVIRRSASFLALLALIATPAVTSTRLFCRFTGQEIIGCAESNTPDHSEVRGEGCCQHRTFRALDGVRLLEEQRQQIPAAVAIDAPGWVADALAVPPPAVRLTAAPSAGPPAFLSHRALLI
jgi:hypothetical protein